MPTFVEAVQSVADDDPGELQRRLSNRIEAVGDAVTVLEEWTESSRETHAELSSKYDTAKSLARDEIRESAGEAGGNGLADQVPAEDLVSHDAVSDRTKRLLSEYSTKLYVFLDEERSYEGAREELLDALGGELALYERLSKDLGGNATSVRDAQEAIARFAREETPGEENATATDVLLDSTVDEESR